MSYYYTAQPYANPVDLDSLLSLLHQQQFRSPQQQQQPQQPQQSRSLQGYPPYYTQLNNIHVVDNRDKYKCNIETQDLGLFRN